MRRLILAPALLLSLVGCNQARVDDLESQVADLGMLPSFGYQGFRTAPIPSGVGKVGDRWGLWWNGREVASVTSTREGATACI